MRADHAARLANWPQVFDIDGASIRLAVRLNTPQRRSAALAVVLRQLADEGCLRGLARRAVRGDARLRRTAPVHLERAAARMFGVTATPCM